MAGAAADKAALRRRAKAQRLSFDPALGAALAAHVLRDCPPPRQAVIGGYWPLGGEIDIRPLLHGLLARGHAVALPETTPAGQPLLFRHWLPGHDLLPGRFATLHPPGAPLTPDYLLIPLLAFDAAGHRLGYGGGYYDRTLAALPGAFRLGCAFSGQEVASLPAEPHDIELHAVATQRGIRRF